MYRVPELTSPHLSFTVTSSCWSACLPPEVELATPGNSTSIIGCQGNNSLRLYTHGDLPVIEVRQRNGNDKQDEVSAPAVVQVGDDDVQV